MAVGEQSIRRLVLPDEDRELSPITGWVRAHWEAVADLLLLSLRPYFSSSRSLVSLPGIVSVNGRWSDSFEGFARSFLLVAIRLHGERGEDPHGFIEWYRAGIIAGSDVHNPERWPRPYETNQAKVEAASIALGLQLTRPWLWDRLASSEQEAIITWLEEAPADPYPANNWLWFRITVETFLASVGGQYSAERVFRDLNEIETFYDGEGWYRDGTQRAFDYYSAWAMQLYPLLWVSSQGAARFGAASLEPLFRQRLGKFLEDYLTLIGADGLPVFQGRSLIYRFAAAAPLWAGSMFGAPGIDHGVLRRGASGMVKAFVSRGAIDKRGLLSVGLFAQWPQMAQEYSGSGSPYWAAKGFLGLALPADHAAWTATERALPVERGDVRRLIRPAGWIVSGTFKDGIVRLINHGTDHGLPGVRTSDLHLYSRLGYSTATFPPLPGKGMQTDSSVAALDAKGVLSHRSGFTTDLMADDGSAACAVSTTVCHWPESGNGPAIDGPLLRTFSIVRSEWEVRLILRLRQSKTADLNTAKVRATGWALAGSSVDVRPVTGSQENPATCQMTVEAADLHSSIVVLRGRAQVGVDTDSDNSPLGEFTAVPWAQFDEVEVGHAMAVAVRISRLTPAAFPKLRISTSPMSSTATIEWPDGETSAFRLDLRASDPYALA